MRFEKGRQKSGGRRSGTANKLTGAFREAVLFVYDGLGGHAAFLQWAQENPTEYYKIAARLIPTEIRHEEDQTVTVILNKSGISPVLDVMDQNGRMLLEDQPNGTEGPFDS
jgi:hypothetical protein